MWLLRRIIELVQKLVGLSYARLEVRLLGAVRDQTVGLLEQAKPS